VSALKVLVVVMGVLIAAGMAVVGYTIVKRASAPAGPQTAQTSAPWGPLELSLPTGARILRTTTDGGRLVVELGLDRGGERVLIVDLASGKLIGTLDLKPQP
jgi:hypothetical protein